MNFLRHYRQVCVLAFISSLAFAGSELPRSSRQSTTDQICDRFTTPTPAPRQDDQRVLEALTRKEVKAIDRIRDKVEEWGVAVISEPVAVLDDTSFYVQPDIRASKDLYTDARSDFNATSDQVNEVGLSNETTANLTPLPPMTATVVTNSAKSSTTAATPAPSATPAPAATPGPMPSQPGLLTDLTNQFGDFSAPFALLQHAQPITKSVTESLREAQDNTVRQKIYTQMSYPKGVPNYTSVLFAIVQVSCNPGWRTQEHYIGDCSASVEYYDFKCKKPISLSERRAPTVFSVLPLMDAQTVEMTNSQRQITQLAFQLAASLPAHGVHVDVNNLLKFVHRYAKDMHSVSPIPVVNSYSSGSTFGFRFSPSFQAQKDPAAKNSRAANVLLPTTFPALVTVVVHDADIDYLLNEKKVAQKDLGLLAHTSTRWYLKDRLPLWQFPKRLFTPMRRDTAAMEIDVAGEVKNVYDVRDQIKEQKSHMFPDADPTTDFDPQFEEGRWEIVALQAKGIGRDWPIPLPAPVRVNFESEKARSKVGDYSAFFHPDIVSEQIKQNMEQQKLADAADKPEITSVTPTAVNQTGKNPDSTPFTVTGNSLSTAVSATLGEAGSASPAPSTAFTPGTSTVQATFDISSFKDGQNVVITLLDGSKKNIVASKPLVVHQASAATITTVLPKNPIVPVKDKTFTIDGTKLDTATDVNLSDSGKTVVSANPGSVQYKNGVLSAVIDLRPLTQDGEKLTLNVVANSATIASTSAAQTLIVNLISSASAKIDSAGNIAVTYSGSNLSNVAKAELLDVNKAIPANPTAVNAQNSGVTFQAAQLGGKLVKGATATLILVDGTGKTVASIDVDITGQ